MTEVVTTERRGPIFEITLDRPKANAIDAPTSRALSEAFVTFRDDPQLWVAILTGTGRFFSAGWDLKAAASGETEEESDYGEGGFGGITEMFELNKPVIAAINGHAAGGGFEMALACDIIIASTAAKMMLSEVKVGVLATGGGIIRLPRRIPHGIAMELLYTGRPMDAEEAYRVGLLSRVTEPDGLMDAAREIAEDITRSAPLSVQAVKSVLRDVQGLPEEQAYQAQANNAEHRAMLESEDFKEGPRAFSEKRDPVWKAR
ncbi:MAG: crotonobetainyl-CoA hydratase [Thiotrichales bacterium]|nr:crotonobetainyl-CoA hydratase [Thiotrichales bacterium]|tara:strand:- start:105 stop:884 length:780 start_codon:yes stop_codon:yes gene_type:complete